MRRFAFARAAATGIAAACMSAAATIGAWAEDYNDNYSYGAPAPTAVPPIPPPIEHGTSVFSSALAVADKRLAEIADDLQMLPREAASLFSGASDAVNSGSGVRALTYGLILFIIGGGAEWLYWTYAGAFLRAVHAAPVASRRRALVLAGRRLAISSCGLLVFAVATLAASTLLPWPPGVEDGVVALTLVAVTVRAAMLLATVVAAPSHPRLRLSTLDTRSAYLWVATVALIALLWALARFAADLISSLGHAAHIADVLRLVTGTALALILMVAAYIALVPSRRRDRDRAIRPPRFPWFFPAAFAIVLTYVLWLSGSGLAALLIADLAFVVALEIGLRRAVGFFWRTPGTDVDDAVILPSILVSLLRFGVVLVGLAIAFLALGTPLAAMQASTSPLMRLVPRLLSVAALCVLANTAWVTIHVSIKHRLERIGPISTDGLPNASSRLLTLLPLLRTTSAVVILVLLVLSSLWALGIEITPLLAGAGVFSLAVGFGAQSLVRDIISGVFFLTEDVFRIGEYIESGTSTKGTVERITLRMVALRHHNGPLHFVPYGSLGTVRNMSRDWVIDKFNIPLPIRTDSESVRKMIKKIGEDLMQDPVLSRFIHEPLKAKLYRIDPGIKVFRCKFQTVPGKQFDIRAQAFKRIEAALKQAGITYAENAYQLHLPNLRPAPAEAEEPSAPQPAQATG